MKTKLFLLSAISIISIGCSSNLTSVDEQAQTLFGNTKNEETIAVVDDTRKRPDEKKKPENGRPSIFGDLLAKLNLTAEQKPAVEKLLTKHKACTEECAKVLKSAERDIMIDAKLKEDAIKAKLSSGEITKEVALRELRELKKKTMEALKAIPVKANVKECMKTCDDAFLTELKGVLNPEQLVILARWQEIKTKRG